MEYLNSDIMTAIDSASIVTLESAINVYDALLNEYNKLIVLEQSTLNENATYFGLIQENSILDTATGKYTDDGPVKKVLMFLPRLLRGIVEAIIAVFNKDYDRENKDSRKSTKYKMENASKEELTQIASQINTGTKGNISFDPSSKKFSIGKKIGNIFNMIQLLTSSAVVFKRINSQINSPNAPYKKFADELKSILKKEKEADQETVSLTLDALHDAMKDSCAAATFIKSSTKELSSILEKKIRSDYAKGKNIDKEMEIKELLDQISGVSKVVSRVTLFGSMAKVPINLLGGKIGTKILQSKDEEQIEELEREKKDIKRQKKAYNKQNKMEQDALNEKVDLYNDIKNETKKRDKAEVKLERDRAKRERTETKNNNFTDIESRQKAEEKANNKQSKGKFGIFRRKK